MDDIMPGVVLKDVLVTKCQECGNREIEIKHLDGLMQAVARAVIAKSGRLVGNEIGFLRELLELSGIEFAALMDSTPPTVSRWENDKTPMGRTADLLLRTIATTVVDPLPTEPTERARLTIEIVRTLAAKMEESVIGRGYTFAFEDGSWQLVVGTRNPKVTSTRRHKRPVHDDRGLHVDATTKKRRERLGIATRSRAPSMDATSAGSVHGAATSSDSAIITRRRGRPPKTSSPRR